MKVSGGMLAHGRAQSAEFRAVVTRADGSVEDLGTIAYWSRNSLKRWAWSINRAAKNLFKGIF